MDGCNIRASAVGSVNQQTVMQLRFHNHQHDNRNRAGMQNVGESNVLR